MLWVVQICWVVPASLGVGVLLTIPPYKQSLPQPRLHNPTPTAVKPRPQTHQPRSPLPRRRYRPCWRLRCTDVAPLAASRHRSRPCWRLLVCFRPVGRTVHGAPFLPGLLTPPGHATNRRGRRPRRPLRRMTGNAPGAAADAALAAPAPHFTTLHRGNISQTSPKHRFLSGY